MADTSRLRRPIRAMRMSAALPSPPAPSPRGHILSRWKPSDLGGLLAFSGASAEPPARRAPSSATAGRSCACSGSSRYASRPRGCRWKPQAPWRESIDAGDGGALVGAPRHRSRAGLAPRASCRFCRQVRPLVHDGRGARARRDVRLLDHPAAVRRSGRTRAARSGCCPRASRSRASGWPPRRSRPPTGLVAALRRSSSGLGVAAYHPEGSKFASYVERRPPRERHGVLLGRRQRRVRARAARSPPLVIVTLGFGLEGGARRDPRPRRRGGSPLRAATTWAAFTPSAEGAAARASRSRARAGSRSSCASSGCARVAHMGLFTFVPLYEISRGTQRRIRDPAALALPPRRRGRDARAAGRSPTASAAGRCCARASRSRRR